MTTQSTEQQKTTTKRPAGNKWRHDASLPQLAKKNDAKLTQEVYDSILWRLEAKQDTNDTTVVGVTSCTRKAGTSTVALNLAVRASAQQGGRVLLIDANWQGAKLPGGLQAEPGPGLYDILSGELSPRECEIQEVAENLDLLPAGTIAEGGAVYVRQEFVEDMLSELKSDYNLIIVDLPFAEELRCALPLARQLNGVLLVTRFESVKQRQAQRILQRLYQDGIEVWGSVLNRHRDYLPEWLRHVL